MSVLAAYGGQLASGVVVTIGVAAASSVSGCLLGLLGAWMKLSRGRVRRLLAEAYTTLVRGLPDLLLIFIVYFGGTAALGKLSGGYVDVDPAVAGITSLAIVFGAYATEIFRGAYLAVPRGQAEGGRALGLPASVIVRLVVLPQAARHALPALGNLSIVILKATSLVSVVGLEDLMRKSTIAAGATREPFTFYAAAAAVYLCLTGVMTWGLHVAEARIACGPGRG